MSHNLEFDFWAPLILLNGCLVSVVQLEIKADTAVCWAEIHELQLIWEDLLFWSAKVKLTRSVFSIHPWYQNTQDMHNYTVYWKQNAKIHSCHLLGSPSPPHLNRVSCVTLKWHVSALSTKPGVLTLLEWSTLEISSGCLLWAVDRSPHLSALQGMVRRLGGEMRRRLQNGMIPVSQSSGVNTYQWFLLLIFGPLNC